MEEEKQLVNGKKKHKDVRRPKSTWGKRSPIVDERVAKRINALHQALWELPPVDLDDVEGTNDRTLIFFQLCDDYEVKALWETYAYALGYSTEYLYKIMQGYYKKQSKDVITKAHRRLKSDLAQLSASGQVNPVTAIFQQKNNYGYVDKVEISATPADPLGESGNLLEIKQRLIESVPSEDVVDGQFTEVVETSPEEDVDPGY